MSSPAPKADGKTRSASPRSRTAVISPFITIEPDYLTFPPPHYGRCIQNVVYLYNTGTVPCVYKLRSQNPDRYIAKPHVAVVAPKSATRIRVTLRNMGDSREANIDASEQDRFRVSVKMLNTPARQQLIESQNYDAKRVWEAAGSTVEHEKDLMAFFKPGVEAPPNGMVTFLPPHYLPVPARSSSSAPRNHSRMGSVATAETPRRNLANEMDAEAATSHTPTPPPSTRASAATGGAVVTKSGRRWRKLAAVCVLISFLVLVSAYLAGSQERRSRVGLEDPYLSTEDELVDSVDDAHDADF